jgi:hypothetical protein
VKAEKINTDVNTDVPKDTATTATAGGAVKVKGSARQGSVPGSVRSAAQAAPVGVGSDRAVAAVVDAAVAAMSASHCC